jgi:acetate kinase
MTDAVLVLNVGSSSIKFAAFPNDRQVRSPLLRGKIANIGGAPLMTAYAGNGAEYARSQLIPFAPNVGRDVLMDELLRWLSDTDADIRIVSVGHRVVHGGRHHDGPALVTPMLLAELEALIPLAPLHQPLSLKAIRAVTAFLPELPQVACFDTSFHRTQPRLAQLFALPRSLTETGVIRYGFHGLSYHYIVSTFPELFGQGADQRVIVAHLGNGASLCAIRHQQSCATSMGFTALDGLMMGQRCGAIDPGVLLYLMEQKFLTSAQISHLLYEESGLLGVSGISSDMSVLEASSAPEAREAIELFCYRAAIEIAALLPAIGGLDALVFTAGIGENSHLVRHLICEHLEWLGVVIDGDANAQSRSRISAHTSRIDVCVMPTDEEVVIADLTTLLLGRK